MILYVMILYESRKSDNFETRLEDGQRFCSQKLIYCYKCREEVAAEVNIC